MQFLNILKKNLIDSQIFVSVCGALFATFFMMEQQTFRWPSYFLIFITYFSGYIYTKFQHRKFFKKILAVNAVCGIICALLIFHNHNEIRLAKWLIIVVLGLLYNSYFLETFVRKIPFLKVFYVGLVWGLMNAWLSFPEFNLPIFLISFCFITALVLPFDIRDMAEDDVVTFPKIIGIRNTQILATLLVILSAVIGYNSLEVNFSIAFLLSCAITLIFTWFSAPTHRDSYFSVGVELCSTLPFLFVVLLQYF